MQIGFSKYSEKNNLQHDDTNTYTWRMYWWNVKDTKIEFFDHIPLFNRSFTSSIEGSQCIGFYLVPGQKYTNFNLVKIG